MFVSQVDGSIPVKPHPEEVDAVKWVSLEEMDRMMEDNGADDQISLSSPTCYSINSHLHLS